MFAEKNGVIQHTLCLGERNMYFIQIYFSAKTILTCEMKYPIFGKTDLKHKSSTFVKNYCSILAHK